MNPKSNLPNIIPTDITIGFLKENTTHKATINRIAQNIQGTTEIEITIDPQEDVLVQDIKPKDINPQLGRVGTPPPQDQGTDHQDIASIEIGLVGQILQEISNLG